MPECSCRRCLEAMLHNVRSELLAGEIRITRPADNRGGRPRAQPDQR